jgi:hypothetical protein
MKKTMTGPTRTTEKIQRNMKFYPTPRSGSRTPQLSSAQLQPYPRSRNGDHLRARRSLRETHRQPSINHPPSHQTTATARTARTTTHGALQQTETLRTWHSNPSAPPRSIGTQCSLAHRPPPFLATTKRPAQRRLTPARWRARAPRAQGCPRPGPGLGPCAEW